MTDNLLIAEFMGADNGFWLDHLVMDMETGGSWYTDHKQPKMPASFHSALKLHGDYGYTLPIDKLQFHKSWDWLMPVVEKIENKFKNDWGVLFEESLAGHYTDIYYIYKECIKFIKSYNKQKK